MSQIRDLTKQEFEVLEALRFAWNKFVVLPEIHPVHTHEFMHAVHAAQHIVMLRPISEGSLVPFEANQEREP